MAIGAAPRPEHDPPSWYEATVTRPPPAPPPEGEVRADVVIVGGGFTGVVAALRLAQAGARVRLLEARRIGWGASGRNGGQLQSGFQRDITEIEAALGVEPARRLWAIAEAGKALVRDLVEKHAIACDVRPGVVLLAHRARHVAPLKAYAEHLARAYGYEALRVLSRAEAAAMVGSDRYFGGLLDEGAAHLHPLALALGLAQAATAAGAGLHEGTRVLRVEPGQPARVVTERAALTADHIVLATGAYGPPLDGEAAARVLPLHNYIGVTAPLPKRLIPSGVAASDSRFVVHYWRETEDRRLLFGGGESYGDAFPPDLAGIIRRRLALVYPGLADVRLDYAWGGTLGITLRRLPYLRRAGNLWTATGYGGHGLALAPIAGAIVAEAILGASERFDLLARLPAPAFPGGPRLRRTLLAAALRWYGLRDRL